MKLLVILTILKTVMSCEDNNLKCRVQVRNREECQTVCDSTSFCDAWTFSYRTNNCYMKERSGWVVVADSGGDSGFKNQGPWYEPSTNFQGGDYCCP